MNIYITDARFYDEFTGSGGVDYLNGNACDKMSVEIEFYKYLGAEDKLVEFSAAAKTITIKDSSDISSFALDGWKVGMALTVDNTASNDGNYTITKVEDRVLTVAEALANESASSANLYDSSNPTGIDFYFNLIENLESESYQGA